MIESDRITAENKAKERRGEYQKRVLYKLPDGSYAGKKDAWLRAWGGNPPLDTKVDASTVVLDKGQEGVDYVACTICGHEGQTLTRHIESTHGAEALAGYMGKLKSEMSEKRLSEGSLKAWEGRERVVETDSSENKTHKQHGLDQDVLQELYVNKGLSDTKIGEQFGLTDVAVSYYRGKFGIKTITVSDRLASQSGDQMTVSFAAKTYNFDSNRLSKLVRTLSIAKKLSGVMFYSKADIERVITENTVPSGLVNTQMIADMVTAAGKMMNKRQVGEKLKHLAIVSKGTFGTKSEWYESSVVELLK